MQRFKNFFFNRLALLAFLLILQIILLFLLITWFGDTWIYVQVTFYCLSLIIVAYILARNDNPAFKIAWIVPILLVPVFGGFFYLFYKGTTLSLKITTQQRKIVKERKQLLANYMINNPSDVSNPLSTLFNNQMWPTYTGTKTKFLSSGEIAFKEILEDLKKAEKFIFLEFFIISTGKMWDGILEILKEKQKQGVEIKVLYDDLGSLNRLPFRYHKKLMSYGFDVVRFNPLRLHLNFAMHYRDHKKIIVIDNKVAYTGGLNISDEYINEKELFGHWSDTFIRVEGKAVWSLTTIFLETLKFSKDKTVNYLDYYVEHSVASDEVVIPFCDIPVNDERLARDAFLSIIATATKTLYITTPYLILDNVLVTQLQLAAKNGVDVRIVIPSNPDKRLVYLVTKSYLPDLVSCGVKVYTYTPGFIHSKLIIKDGDLAMLGTSNLDYRSLYLHFENNLILSNSKSLMEIDDFFKNVIEVSKLVEMKDIKKRSIFYRAFLALLRGFSPLL